MKDQLENMRRLFVLRPCRRIPVYELIRIAAQYNARIHELRAEGLNLVNHKTIINGVVHSEYEYLPQGELFGSCGFGKGAKNDMDGICV